MAVETRIAPGKSQQTASDQSSSGRSPGPGSLMWKTYSDMALAPFSIPILVMQAAHPDVGAAVAKYSIYKHEPWGRLFRTGFSLMRFMYGGRDGKLGKQEARDLRALHAHIRGRRSDGSSFHALTPQTYRIVPDTFLDGLIRFHEAVNKPLTGEQKSQVYEEYANLCELFGIDREHLEPNFAAFERYYDNLLLNVMNYNDTVEFLLGDMMKFGPAIRYLPMPARWWQWLYQHTLYPVIRIFTIGFLDPRFRRKHQIAWSEQDQRRYQRYLSVVRWCVKIVPRWARYSPFALYVMCGGRGMKLVSFDHLKKYLEK